MSETPVPELVAHRGAMRHYPENTWPALEAALKAGACYLEFDIQMCRDDGFVLLHDDNFLRTGGIDQSVFELASTAIDISVHEPARLGERFAPTATSTLDDILGALSAWPHAHALVEIKQESLDRWGLETVMQALLPRLEAHRGPCTLISYSATALAWCRAHSDIPVGWVLTRYDTDHRQQAEALAPDYLICNHTKIEPTQTPWPGAWRWMLYDITDAALALDWARRGVALIESADVGALFEDETLRKKACDHGL